jgi:protein phosphatase
MSLRWFAAASTHVGNVRRLNEDSILSLPEAGLWVVADGMGGHAAGDMASQAVIESLGDGVPGSTLAERVEETTHRLLSCNVMLYLEAQKRGSGIIGSTVVALVGHQNKGTFVWAGDSRGYRLRGGLLEQLTEDHSRTQELIASGALTAEEARHHPQNNVVTRAVGATEVLQVATVTVDVQVNDIFMLCSDGLTGEMVDADIEAKLRASDCQQSVDSLLDTALGGEARDNVSVIVVQVQDDTPTEFSLEDSSSAESIGNDEETLVSNR